jgi:hypothetical protein
LLITKSRLDDSACPSCAGFQFFANPRSILQARYNESGPSIGPMRVDAYSYGC